jgi:hypothetical protein
MNLPVKHQKPFRSSTTAGLAMLFSVMLAACAPDAFKASSPFDAYLTQIQTACAFKNIGRMVIPPNSQLVVDPLFQDLTSRFYFGKISQAGYVDGLSGSFDARPDAPGIVCILNVPTK